MGLAKLAVICDNISKKCIIHHIFYIMVNKLKITLFLVLAFVLLTPTVLAQSDTNISEAIISFESKINVNPDNSINVTEVIVYTTGAEARHGILRDITTLSAQKKKMAIENISVTDENFEPYNFEVTKSFNNINLKIGDAGTTFTGQKIYIIKYTATKAVGQFETFDEIYWNVTGNSWKMPIQQASATITLPTGAVSQQQACYYGAKGSKDSCQSSNTDNKYFFKSPTLLNPQAGLTIAVGFPKGFVTAYSQSEKMNDFLQRYLPWFFAITLSLITFIVCYYWWEKYGRDPKGRDTIIPQYTPPADITPIEAYGIVKQSVSFRSLPAEIIYLATQGYLQIKQLDDKDFELVLLKQPTDLKNDFDIKIVEAFFKDKKINESIVMSEVESTFYRKVSPIVDTVLDSLVKKDIYKNLGRMKRNSVALFIIIYFISWPIIFFASQLTNFLFAGNVIILYTGFITSLIIILAFYYLSPAKTEKGVALKEYLLGLKDYLRIAEKDRLEFHNAPEKTPEVFEKLLPYAMALGVLDIWTKEFDEILTTPPSWYTGLNNTAFSAHTFGQSLNGFALSTITSISPASSSSGSSGGGFSGGGGGGGGGGSW